MKKVISLVLVMCLIALFALTGCSSKNAETPKENSQQPSKEESKVEFPTKPITVIVSYAAGGGTDTGARILMPYVEKELGVEMVIANKPGGGGWVGWTELLNAKPDGYTIGYINSPNIFSGYLNPAYKRDATIEDFALIANHVVDYGAIAVRADDKRFETIDDLIEYAKNHEVTTTSTGVGSDDHIASLKLNDKLGTKFVAVHGKGAAYGKSGVLGGHIDAYFANVGEVTVPAKNGEVRVLAVMAPERSKFLPDVPTLEEKGYGKVYSWSARGLAAPKGVPEDRLNIIIDAFEKAINNSEQVEKMNKMGLDVKFMKGEEYYKFLKDDEAGIIGVKDLLGW
ncbi:MAG: putative tricarboxylic transport rane protein [Thermosediminibacterales bacterium]|nr:putative tricarboxylic transport rane protein [Thermosediminibacterales bacterium]MDK2835712.1 putative tricarboxylic transport rane protein [Thermosediminibacterales bacterium]